MTKMAKMADRTILFVGTFYMAVLSCVVCSVNIENCDSSYPLIGKDFHFPKELVGLKGNTVNLKFKLVVKRKITQNLIVDLTLKKHFYFWFKIPCFSGKVGSCQYNLPCRSLKNIGLPCHIEKGVYSINEPVKIPAKIPIPSFIASGEYEFEAEIKDKDNPQFPPLACFKGNVTLQL